MTTAAMLGDISPWMKWSMAAIAGGGAAGAVQVTTTVARGASSMLTGGTGNWIVSTGEGIGAVITAILAIVVPILVFIGFNVTFFTQFFMGSQGMPRRYYNYLEQFEFYHQISTIGSYVLALGLFIALWSWIDSIRNGEKAPQNPWNASTLEWRVCSSPPIEHNFHETPHVTTGPYHFGIEEGHSD